MGTGDCPQQPGTEPGASRSTAAGPRVVPGVAGDQARAGGPARYRDHAGGTGAPGARPGRTGDGARAARGEPQRQPRAGRRMGQCCDPGRSGRPLAG